MRDERKRRAKGFLPRSTEFRWSVFIKPRTKVHSIERDTCGYLERRISLNIQERRFWEIKVVGFRRLPTRVSMLQEVRDSFYLGLLSIFGLGKEGFSFKGQFNEEKLDFQVLLDVSSPRKTLVRLGKGINLLRKEWFFS